MIKFRCFIPQTRRAFEIPGARSELRVMFELGEDQVAAALPLILLRGTLFDMSLQIIEEKEVKGVPLVKKVGSPIQTYGSISSRDASIKINGLDGMMITMAIPALSESTLVKLLALREKYLEIEITEDKDRKDKKNGHRAK